MQAECVVLLHKQHDKIQAQTRGKKTSCAVIQNTFMFKIYPLKTSNKTSVNK